MSVEAITWAWRQSLPPNGKLVLVALADHARDDGSQAWPSVALLARKTGYGTRQVQRILGELVNQDVIRVETPSTPTRPTTYTLNIEDSFTYTRQDFRPVSCPRELRRAVIERDQYVCQVCRQSGDEMAGPDGFAWEADRIKPGGTYELGNVRLACRTCNRHRGTRQDDAPPAGGVTMTEGGVIMTEGGVTDDASPTSQVTPEPSFNHQGTKKSSKDDEPTRIDVQRVCNHLAHNLRNNGVKPTTVTQAWRDEARRLLDRDQRPENEVHELIEWATAHHFWRSAVLSMPKFRKQYDAMRLQRMGNGSRSGDRREPLPMAFTEGPAPEFTPGYLP